MITLAQAMAGLIAAPRPILFLDTCTLLDIVRAPLRDLPGDHVNETRRERGTDLVQTDVAAPGGGGLRQFAEHHQFGQRRN